MLGNSDNKNLPFCSFHVPLYSLFSRIDEKYFLSSVLDPWYYGLILGITISVLRYYIIIYL